MDVTTAIKQGASNPDLNAALGPIQQALGVTTGDVAGHVFSSVADDDPFNEDYWPHASPEERMQALSKYAITELDYLSESYSGVRGSAVESFDPYTDPDTKAMLERAGIATHKYRR